MQKVMEGITLNIIPLKDLNLQTPPAGSDWDKIVENVAKGYYVFGNYAGDESFEQFFGLANYNHRKPCTGFGLILGRKGLPVDAGGNPAPLYIGLTTTDEISGDGIYQPENWSKAGILYPEDLPEPETWYWIYASFPDDPYPDVFHMLVAITDTYYEEGTQNYWLWGAIDGEIDEYPKHGDVFHGWAHGGWSPIPDMLCFFTWTEYEAPVCTNPDGAEGQIDACGTGSGNQPDATHKYKCVSGTWEDQGYNPDCVTPVCTNPSGSENDIICGDPYYGQDPTHKYKCQDGVWVDQGYSPDCIIACTDPSGAEGDFICGDPLYEQDPTHKYKCQDGVWVDQGYSPDCVEECSPEGSRKCVGADLYECQDGKWILIEENSPECFDIMAFLPWIAVGAGAILVTYGLITTKKPSKA